MKNYNSRNSILFMLLAFVFNSCTETYPLLTNTFEEDLVVEATITNELKTQEIKISKTSKFENTTTTAETGAVVYITDNASNRYNFAEQSGTYISESEFQAVPGREYRLNIKTSNGKSYQSTVETMSPINPINDLNIAVETKDTITGVSIKVNSYDPKNSSKYYRFEYEETYKIITPHWSFNTAVVIPAKNAESNPQINLIPNSLNTRICYGSKKSTDIILTTTAELAEDRLNFPIRFISNKNYIISYRYSILVRQYIENLAAYSFYETLNKMSGSESVLSPKQPGFLNGNLKSVSNPNEKVIGFFDVASVSSKRVYFNYLDLFPGQAIPPYYIKCPVESVLFCFGLPLCNGNALATALENHSMTYSHQDGITYYIYPAPCGDCTTFASNIKPLFWEE